MAIKNNPKKNSGVKTMLSIKTSLSERFAKNPDSILTILSEIRKKYNLSELERKKLSLR